MNNAKSKYANYVQDKLWKIPKTMADIKKESDIVVLNSKIDHLEALLAKSNFNGGSTQDSAFSNTNKRNNKTGWKIEAPKTGEFTGACTTTSGTLNMIATTVAKV